jgi:ubiquitin carboxyl-terminal hydrolase 7
MIDIPSCQLNTRHEYPSEIDLAEFLDSTTDRRTSWVYNLHGVIVHDGTLRGGQYVTYFKPSRTGRWLKFDDQRVTFASDYEVFDRNYGAGEDGDMRATNAYVLIYIRESMIERVFASVTESDIPPYLGPYFIAFRFWKSF